MATAPAPVPAAPTPVASPPHLLRRKMIDIILRRDGGFRRAALVNGPLPLRRYGRQRRRLGFDDTRGQRGRTCDKPKGEFQKVAAFHHVPPYIRRDSFAAPR